jgi:hypothetical protein
LAAPVERADGDDPTSISRASYLIRIKIQFVPMVSIDKTASVGFDKAISRLLKFFHAASLSPRSNFALKSSMIAAGSSACNIQKTRGPSE